MIDLSIATLRKCDSRSKRIGMLASPAVRLVGLYKSRLEQAGFEAVFPDAEDEARLLGVIRAVKAGSLTQEHRTDYAQIAANLAEAGVDAFLIACTELSVIGPPAGVVQPSTDTLDVLVEATIATARS